MHGQLLSQVSQQPEAAAEKKMNHGTHLHGDDHTQSQDAHG
jgi:hypothetical protein